jgi:hypothetical protein
MLLPIVLGRNLPPHNPIPARHFTSPVLAQSASKHQLGILSVHFNAIARLEFSIKQFDGERIEQLLLNGALQWPRPKLRIIPFTRQQSLRGRCPFKGQMLLRQSPVQPRKLNLHDRAICASSRL